MIYGADKLGVDRHTHRHRQTQATTIPEGQNWPRVKMICVSNTFIENNKIFRLNCSLGDLSFLRKTGHYFKKNCAYLVSLCLHEQVGDTIVDGWSQFECNFNGFADMILPYGSHDSQSQNLSTAINVTGRWLSCFATCNWLRAQMHPHCDVMVTTSTTKTWWSCWSLGSICHAYKRKFAIKIQC